MLALPEKLAPAKQDLAKLETMLQAEKDRLADTERWKADQEEQIRRDQEGLIKAKSKLQASKGAKDYAAASREVENKRRAISEREEEVLKVIEALEKSRGQITAHEEDVGKLRDSVQAEESSLIERISELKVEAEERAAGRDQLVSQLDQSIYKRYEFVMRKRVFAVCPLVKGICQGCHMSVPPQLANIIARVESIESCPHCQRLLFAEEMRSSAASDAAEG